MAKSIVESLEKAPKRTVILGALSATFALSGVMLAIMLGRGIV